MVQSAALPEGKSRRSGVGCGLSTRDSGEVRQPSQGRCAPTWARLIAKVHDELSIRRILDHLGLSAPPQDKPPPVREILRVAEHGESWGVPADWESPPAPAARETSNVSKRGRNAEVVASAGA